MTERKSERESNVRPVPSYLARAIWRGFEAIWPPEPPAERSVKGNSDEPSSLA